MRNLISQHTIRRAVEKSTSEASVQAAILGYLRARRIPHTITEAKQSFNQNGQQVRRLAVGWPDITACFEGRFLGIEVKRPVGGRLRYLQAIELEAQKRLIQVGGDVMTNELSPQETSNAGTANAAA
jgi:hypothetical protein